MAFCAALFQGVAVWAGLPATLFALMLLLGFRLNTRFTWVLLLLGLIGLSTEGLSIACTGWSTGSALLPGCSGLKPVAQGLSPQRIWWINASGLVVAVALILVSGISIWRLLWPPRGSAKTL